MVKMAKMANHPRQQTGWPPSNSSPSASERLVLLTVIHRVYGLCGLKLPRRLHWLVRAYQAWPDPNEGRTSSAAPQARGEGEGKVDYEPATKKERTV